MNKTPTKDSTPQNSSVRKTGRQIVFLVTLGGIIAVTSLLLFSSEGTSKQTDTPKSDIVLQQVGVMPLISRADSFSPLRYTATVVARRRSQLSFQASERIDELLVDEGDRVEAGQLLARQDDTALAAQHDAAVAQVKRAAAVLAELKQGPRQETIAVARAEMNRMQAQADLAKTNLQRHARLRQSRAGSMQEFDTATAERAQMKAAVTSAQQRLVELETGTRQERLDAQEAAFEIAVATAKQTAARLQQTRIFAPFSGKISRRFIDEGSLPQRGSPVLEIVEVDHLEVRFGVAASIARKLEIAQRLPFTLDHQTFYGQIRQIQPTLDLETRTQEIIVDADPQNTLPLVDGLTVQIEFATPTLEPGIWLPSEALQRQVRGLWSVLVLDENDKGNNDSPNAVDQATVARRDVELLETWGQWSRVRGTLETQDRIIVAGSSRVSVGQRVAYQTIQMPPPWHEQSVQLSDRSPQ